MSERQYGINYSAKTDGAKTAIAGLKSEILSLHAAANASKGAVSGLIPKVSPTGLSGLDKAATLLGTIGATAGSVEKTAEALGRIDHHAVNLTHDLPIVVRSLKEIGDQDGRLRNVASALGGIELRGDRARVTTIGLGSALEATAGHGTAMGAAAGGVEKVQRKLYGAKKNAEELNAALEKTPAAAAAVGAASGPIKQVAIEATGAKTALRGASGGARGLGRALSGLAAKVGVLNAVRQAAMGVGDALNDARSTGDKGADKVLAIRDQLREVANLQGKSAPDDATAGQAFKLRISSGMSMGDADQFMRKFYGSIEAGRDKGNIDAETAEKVKDVAGTVGVRTGMHVGTAGDLGASLSNYGKITSSDQAAGQMGVIVDQLNKGRGDLTPLTNSLLKTAGKTVGANSAFHSLPELAAAIGVGSNNASPSVAGTMVTQTMRGLSMSGKDSDKLIEKAGIKGGDDFQTRLDKIAPHVEKAEKDGQNPLDYLRSEGFGNITDRQGIAYFVKNRELLRTRLGQVKAGAGADGQYRVAAADTLRKNDEFRGSDVAANRIGDAVNDAAEYERDAPQARLQIDRKHAEARLKADGKIDTGWANVQEKVADVGGLLPALGYKPAHQVRIDKEAESTMMAEARAKGIDPRKMGGYGSKTMTYEQQYSEVAGRLRTEGVNTSGTASQTRMLGLMERQIKLTEEANRQRERRQAEPPIDARRPVVPR